VVVVVVVLLVVVLLDVVVLLLVVVVLLDVVVLLLVVVVVGTRPSYQATTPDRRPPGTPGFHPLLGWPPHSWPSGCVCFSTRPSLTR